MAVFEATKHGLADIQDGLDKAQNGETIWLVGEFDLTVVGPDGVGADGVLYLRNADVAHLDVRGVLSLSEAKLPDPKPAVIKNAVLKWGLTPDPSAEDGLKCIPVSATVTNIVFDGFTGTGIAVSGTVGENKIHQCTFKNYRYRASPGGISGAWPIRAEPRGKDKAALLPSTLTGTLAITTCVFEPPEYDSIPAGGMNNLLHLNNAHLDLLRIADNVIQDMSWAGVAVWGILGRTEIVGNQITLLSKKPYAVGAGVKAAAILFGGRPKGYRMNCDGSVLIERNTITIDRVDAAGIDVQLFADADYKEGAPAADREIVIRNNVVHMMSENNEGFALGCLGACSGSSWTGNIVTGHARFGIRVSKEGVPGFAASSAAPSDNTFEYNVLAGGHMVDPTKMGPLGTGIWTDFESFTASQAQVFVDSTPLDATSAVKLHRNSVGPVSGSNFGPTPFETPCAGIVSLGENVEMKWNHFSSSGLKGWRLHKEALLPGDHNVGCIYLAPETHDNKITWCKTNFPAKSAPLPQRQILDLAANVTIEQEETPEIVFQLPWLEVIGPHWEIPVESIPRPQPRLSLIGVKP